MTTSQKLVVLCPEIFCFRSLISHFGSVKQNYGLGVWVRVWSEHRVILIFPKAMKYSYVTQFLHWQSKTTLGLEQWMTSLYLCIPG